MIFDHRTYTCRPGTLKKHLTLYEKFGWLVQSKHLGQPVLYASTETGDVNSYIHVWVYESAADRAKKRTALQADQAWVDYLGKSAEAGFLVAQTNSILTPVSFFDSNKS